MARPKQFDREDALTKAIDVFRKYGYASASTDVLLESIGIGRQSLYDTFGDKRRLYLEALRRYNSESVSAALEHVESAPTALKGIENLLLDYATRKPAEHALGCMGINSICEFGTGDSDVAEINRASGAALQTAFAKALRKAKAAGEVPESLQERDAAQFILAALAGMKVHAKGGASVPALKQIARFAIQALKMG
jgi:TetR/AcrR family transcriptional regulator, transcriptional repressor for nem operon